MYQLIIINIRHPAINILSDNARFSEMDVITFHFRPQCFMRRDCLAAFFHDDQKMVIFQFSPITSIYANICLYFFRVE